MLRSRIIPCLLLRSNRLVKTIQFREGKYIGDPLNAVRIFNEKEVDELMVFDIDATIDGKEPNFPLIAHLASECRMPIGYGGGVKRVDQAVRLVSIGVEKVAISSAAIANPNLVKEVAAEVGRQSVVIVLDVRRDMQLGTYRVWTHNGTTDTGFDPVSLAKMFEASGAGEIVINSIDCDGMMNGYDIELASMVREAVSLPLTVLGGAGNLSHVQNLIKHLAPIGAAAGSIFVFKGVHRAVLINYPNRIQKRTLMQS